MKVPYLSASRVKLAQDCALQYSYKYDPQSQDIMALKHKSNHRNNLQAARVGTNIHNALEEWRRPNPETGRVRRPVHSQLVKLYDQENTKNEVDFDSYMDGKRMIDRWFADRGSQKVKVIEVEQGFGSHKSPHILSNGVPVFGFIDLVFEHPNGTIELLDYKSQRKPITQAEADSNVQAGIYLAVARELYPGKPLRFSFDLLRYGVVTTVWTDEKLDEFCDWLKTKYEWLLSIPADDAPPTIGEGCRWCPFVDACPAAQRLIHAGAWDMVVGEDPSELDKDEMLDTLAAVKAAKSILDKKQRQIENQIKSEWFEDKTRDEGIETDRWSVRFADRNRTEFIPSVVQRIVPTEAFGQMVSLSKQAVDRILPILPDDVAKQVSESATIKPYRTLTIRRRADSK